MPATGPAAARPTPAGRFGPVRPEIAWPGSSPTSADHRRRAGWVSEFSARQLAAPVADRELTVLTNLCQQLLISNEFLYVD